MSVVVSAQILGPQGEAKADLMVDTGATYSMLSYIVLRAVGYEPDATLDRRTILTASQSESIPILRVQRFRALGRERLNFPVLCHNLPSGFQADGLLGLDFVRSLRLSLAWIMHVSDDKKSLLWYKHVA
jgi:predicted aspartyl protease